MNDDINLIVREETTTESTDTQGSDTQTPLIIYTGEQFTQSTYTITADGEVIGETKDFIDAVKVLICTYYNFNVAYPTKACASLTFIQKMVMNLQDSVPPIKKLQTFVGAMHTNSVSKM